MTRRPTEQAETVDDDRIAAVLATLDRVSAGDLDARLPVELDERDSFRPLYRGINQIIERVAVAEREAERKVAMIERQRAAIRELSTPVIEVWDGALCLPLVGVLDSARSAQMTDVLMQAVVEKQASFTIIDITGIATMDTGTADHFIRMAKAVRLLGARCVLSGMSPQIAQTIVHMGVDLAGLSVHPTLRDALRAYIVEHRAFLPEATGQRARRRT